MHSRKTISPLWLVLLFILPGCSHIKSSHDYNPEIDYSSLKTYAWTPDQPRGNTRILHTNKLLLDRIQRAVDSDLAAKGIQKTSPGEASFMVRALFGADHDIGDNPEGYPHSEQSVHPETYKRSSRTKRYDEGTLILDFVDPRNEQLIWRGTGESRIRKNTTPTEREKKIREVVQKILSHYPPPPPDSSHGSVQQ